MSDQHNSGKRHLDVVLELTKHPADALLQHLVALAAAASDLLLGFYARTESIEIRQKSDASPVTEADHASHELISQALHSLTPNIPILSEESPASELASRLSWPCCWMLDPLDGTREFIERTGEFTINLALIAEGVPQLGVLAAPTRGFVDVGIPGAGAWRYSLSDPSAREELACRALESSRALALLASRRHSDDRVNAMINALAPLAESVARRDIGSALKFCDLACGQADVYPRTSPCFEWDLAAGEALVNAAGGRVLTIEGETILYNCRDTLMAPQFVAAADPGVDYLRYLGSREG